MGTRRRRATATPRRRRRAATAEGVSRSEGLTIPKKVLIGLVLAAVEREKDWKVVDVQSLGWRVLVSFEGGQEEDFVAWLSGEDFGTLGPAWIEPNFHGEKRVVVVKVREETKELAKSLVEKFVRYFLTGRWED